MSWHYKTKGTYYRHREHVKSFCFENFGKEHIKVRNHITGKFVDNHGNWKFDFDGKIKFRYEKDLTWFLLQWSEKADPDWMRTIGR